MHTPGPWTAALVGDGGGKGLYELQAGVHTLGEYMHEDDARLAAAAPDLLEALKGLLADIEDYQRINKLGGEDNHWQVIARAAIAKATAPK